MPQYIEVELKSQGQRLDRFLVENLDNFSRSQIQKMIKLGEILVNNKQSTVHKFLKNGDEIKIKSSDNIVVKKSQTKNQINKSKLTASDKKLFSKIKVVAQEPDFLIIEKPASLLVHSTEKEETNTLVDWLLQNYPQLRQIGENPARPAIVHRLDRDVSGLMIIPLNQDSFDYFKDQFKKHLITKKYTALVYDQVDKDEDEISFPIGRSKTRSGLYAAHPREKGNLLTNKDKQAITRFKVKQKFINYSLLEVEILTGRTHQIRVHLLAYGHPIVGDNLYYNRKISKRPNKDKVARIFLHASYLSFIGLSGKKFEFLSDLPGQLVDFINTLK